MFTTKKKMLHNSKLTSIESSNLYELLPPLIGPNETHVDYCLHKSR